jgi:Mn-dependent DtxR family transcriptional regulator
VDLARMAGVKPAAVNHQIKKLRNEGHIEEGDALALTPAGRERLLEIWPELETAMVQQGELALRHVL